MVTSKKRKAKSQKGIYLLLPFVYQMKICNWRIAVEVKSVYQWDSVLL